MNKNIAISSISAIGLFIGSFILLKIKMREASSIAAIGLFSALLSTFLLDIIIKEDLDSQIKAIDNKHGVKVENKQQQQQQTEGFY